jgi:hypothetical protein
MLRLLFWGMLAGVSQAFSVFAEPPSTPPSATFAAGIAGAISPAAAATPEEQSAPRVVASEAIDFRGLGKDRENLTPELIASRSRRLEATTSFYLLRFPQAAGAPARIFDEQIWKSIRLAAEQNDLDPMVLAGMIFIESFGEPLAKSPTGPSGIAQMTKSSAKEMGLVVGKKIQIGTREVTKQKTVGRGKKKRTVTETKREKVYRTLDERFEPDRAIMAMAKRVSNRRAWLGGKVDFAIAEYHMGAGRMTKLLSAYFGRKIKPGDMPEVMRASSVSYGELFWANTPYFRPEVYKQIEQLNRVDFSPTYYFRVQQAMRLLALYRKAPSEYAALAASYRGRAGQTVNANLQRSFVTDEQAAELTIRRSQDIDAELGQRIVTLPAVASERGVRADKSVSSPLAGERSTIGCLLFVADQLQRLQGSKYRGLETSSMVKSLEGDSRKDAPKASDSTTLPMHTFGWAFDLARKPLSKDAVRDLNFILMDLRFAGLLTFAEEGKPKDFHVVRHPDYALRFEKFYWDTVGVPQAKTTPNAATQQTTAADGPSLNDEQLR